MELHSTSRRQKLALHRKLKWLLLYLTFLPLLSQAQTELSVPFKGGFIGSVGANTQQANSITTFSTLGIVRAFFVQVSSTSQFEVQNTPQGNDIGGKARFQFADGTFVEIPGAIVWRISPGGNTQVFGFVPRSTVNTSFSYGSGSTYTITGGGTSGTSNIGMLIVSSNLTFTNGSNESGNAANVLSLLNTYLTTTNSSKPLGPVTANSQTTASTTPTLTGTVTLRTGESLQVLINGHTYTTADGLVVDGTTNTWSMPIPSSDPLTVGSSYEVNAVITNADGYVLSSKGTVNVVAPNAGTLSGTQAICSNGTSQFTTDGTSGGNWTSDNTAVATVDASTGLVTGVAAGTATITYTISGLTATRTVTVTAAPNAGSLSGTQAICFGSTSQFSSNGDNGGNWISSDITIATVNATTGLVSAVAAGTATITYTVTGTGGCSDATATRTITVTAAPTAGTITGTLSTTISGTTTLSITGNSATGTWSSLNTNIATIDPTTGVVTGVAAGTATIKYTVTGTGGCSDATTTETVTITAAPTAGTIAGTQEICLPGTTQFTTDGTSGGSWTSSNENVATVNSSTGLVTGVAAGTATITYTVGSSTATRTVTVTAAPNAGSLSGTQAICFGTTSQFSSNGDNGGEWISSNDNIATVNRTTGLVSAVAAGTATITYTVAGTGGCSDATATRTITVTAAPTAGTISGTLTANIGFSTTLTSNGDSGGTWSSTNTAVAIVDNAGVVTGVSAGTATIYYVVAGSGGCAADTASANVTIQQNQNGCFGTISGSGAGLDPRTSDPNNPPRDLNWKVVAVPQSLANDSQFTVPYDAYVPVGVPHVFLGGIWGGPQQGFFYNGERVWWIAPTQTTRAIATPSYKWIAAAEFNIGASGNYIFNFKAAGDNFVSFIIDGTIDTSDPERPTIVGGTQIGSEIEGFHTVHTFQGTVSLTAGQHTAYMVLRDEGGDTAAMITKSVFDCADNLTDADNDGVPDIYDFCLNTPAGETVDANGCSESQKDDDNDGVMNDADLCPGTPLGQAVNSSGCSSSQANAGTISGNDEVCLNQTATYTSNGTAGGTWTSSDTQVATIDASTGLVTALLPGTTTLTYTVSGASTTKTISVIFPPYAGDITGDTQICIEGTTQLTAGLLATPSVGSTPPSNTWISSNTAIATVDPNSGLVTGVSAGTATIYYISFGSGGCENDSSSINITVTAPPTAGTISGTLSTTIGNTTVLSISGNSAVGTWSSSDEQIATVNPTTGVVTGVNAGSVTITYTVAGSGGCSDATTTTTVSIDIPDSDGDGVLDDIDLCPDTPACSPVDANGCADSQKDTDNDGVTDDIDLCPNTPDGEAVDANGCSESQKDNDGDGVSNAQERIDGTDPNDPCDFNPNSQILANVTSVWEALDCDGDGNPNGSDPNPTIPKVIDEVETAEVGVPYTFNLIANDDFLPSPNLRVIRTGGTAQGPYTLNENTGEITYTPLRREAGTSVTITYRVTYTPGSSNNTPASAAFMAFAPAGVSGEGTATIIVPTSGDDDNDGVVNEIDECPNTPAGMSVDEFGCGFCEKDSNNDGTPDCASYDDDGDGINNFLEGLFDQDGDGIPNYLDLDSDGDGIPDSVETFNDADGDGIPNFLDLDSDGDGIADISEKDHDRDDDGIPNFLDLDSDGDGIPDSVETVEDFDGDGIANFLDFDSDNDTILDKVETANDADGDGIPNYLDLDSDGDKIADISEKDHDRDEDGIPNFLDLDSDGDGILDETETVEDFDGDGIANFLDFDSDNDGILDIIETAADFDGDGALNFLDLDSDNDGILDAIETANDFDGDGAPNFLDLDSDNDGISDKIETENDFDGDGAPNFLDLDSDNDGISDKIETDNDFDGDGAPNFLDLDSDNDGISDKIETENDFDGDGAPNFLDLDSDNDGILDAIETANDFDGDGAPNFLDLDSDNDGISDKIETDNDFDGDGAPNFLDLDSDNDGISDKIETENDFDGDGAPNFLDLDSDNDTILDSIETDKDFDGDGKPNFLDLDSDNDSIPDKVEKADDADGDGAPNFLDLDSDGDSIPDRLEAGANGANPVDTDNDGKPDFLDIDSDNDTIPDFIEAGPNGATPVDTDNDGTPDFRDLDSDNDTHLDIDEAGPDGYNPWDTDNDGIYNFRDLDSDSDGILDIYEEDIEYGNMPDCNGNGIPNILDPEECTVFVPEAITPNGDGLNDYLVIPGIKRFQNNQIRIFNRWGVLVFEQKNYQNQWQGECNQPGVFIESDRLLPDATYYYIIEFNGERKATLGSVYLNRISNF